MSSEVQISVHNDSTSSDIAAIVFGVLASVIVLFLFGFWLWKRIHKENYREAVKYKDLALAPMHDPMYSMADVGGVSGHYHNLSHPIYTQHTQHTLVVPDQTAYASPFQ